MRERGARRAAGRREKDDERGESVGKKKRSSTKGGRKNGGRGEEGGAGITEDNKCRNNDLAVAGRIVRASRMAMLVEIGFSFRRRRREHDRTLKSNLTLLKKANRRHVRLSINVARSILADFVRRVHCVINDKFSFMAGSAFPGLSGLQKCIYREGGFPKVEMTGKGPEGYYWIPCER